MFVADLHFRATGSIYRGNRDPVNSIRSQARFLQIAIRTDIDALIGRFGRDHVKRFSGCDAQAPALADCEMMSAAVAADDSTAGVHNFTLCGRRRDSLISKVSVNEGRIITVRYEADFL